MAHINGVEWYEVFNGYEIKPTRRQVRLARKLLRQWNIPIGWVSSIDAYDLDSRKELKPEERDGMVIRCKHPNVPATVNSFHLDNSAGDRQYAYWRWDS